MKTYLLRLLSLFLLAILALSCGEGAAPLTMAGECDEYTESVSSPYLLPFSAGETHKVAQGNCSSVSHFGAHRYAYDFSMDIGTNVLAIRSGTVIEVQESFADGNGCPNDNHIYIEHADGTVASYVHLTSNGASVSVGESVIQGEIIGRSGNTGCSTGPHLHLVVFKNRDRKASVPLTFSNTDVHSRGLVRDKAYTAF
jgi:hypothetical protein